MKNSFFYTLFLFLTFHEIGVSQNRGWTTNNAFNSDVFVENLGQFNTWAKTDAPIKYVVNNSDKIFFTQKGVTFQLLKFEKVSEREREKSERKGGEREQPKVDFFYVNMNWEGCNPNAVMNVSEVTENYYTFGEKNYETIRAKGYKKLVYKDLYPKIDVEYIIPQKGGIKYQLILHPGADLSVVKMNYSGDVNKIKIDYSGNIVIKTPAGNITDHAPQSFYEQSKTDIPSGFELEKNIVSFKIKTAQLSSGNTGATFIIDPWTITPTSLTPDNTAYDIDYDDYGNVYVYGGVKPYQLAKYSAGGVLQWVFTNPISNGQYKNYSKFCTIRKSGTTFIGEGNGPTGPRVLKIDHNGNLLITSMSFPNNGEIWEMFYNKCTGQLIGFGGGVSNNNNLQIISDTNLTSNTAKNFNTFSQGSSNDVTAVKMDFNGDFYALMCYNSLQKSLFSNNYNLPLGWDMYSGYSFSELSNYGIPGFSGNSETNRANALALNSNYLFSYDGQLLIAWDKSNGAMLGSEIVNSGYYAGSSRNHEGIAVDECNKVYVGGTAMVHVFSFDGTTFVKSPSITNNIPDEVYDISVDGLSGILYISGNGFVTVKKVTTCGTSPLVIKDSSNCLGYASVKIVSGGTPPFSYRWSNGATTSTVTGLSTGIYTVTIGDNSCLGNNIIDTIRINSATYTQNDSVTICEGDTYTFHDGTTSTVPITHINSIGGGCDSVIVTKLFVRQSNYNVAVGICNGNTYTFPDGTTSSTSGVHKSKYKSYTGCDSIIVTTLTVHPLYNLNVTASTCNGNVYTFPDGTTSTTATVHTSNIKSKAGCDSIIVTTLQENMPYNQKVSVSLCNGNRYVFPDGTTSYVSTVNTSSLKTSNDCDSTIVTTLTVNPVYKIMNPQTICGGQTYSFQTHNYSIPGNYYDTLQTYLGCDSIIVTQLKVNPTYSLNVSASFCNGNVYTFPDGTTSGTATVHTSNLKTIAGCDSVIVTTLTEHLPINQNVSVSVCSGSVYTFPDGTISSIPDIHTSKFKTKDGCDSNIVTTLSIYPIPIVAVNSTTICKGSNTRLTASGAVSYVWSNGGGLSSSLITSPLSETTYTVTGTDANGCLATATSTVTILQKPEAQFSAFPNPAEKSNPIISFTNQSSKDVDYWFWNFGDNETSSANTPSPQHLYPSTEGEYIVTLKVRNASLCFDSINLQVVVDSQYAFYIPNAFTPDGDGSNDVFFGKGVGIIKYELKIFDRWGLLIFNADDINKGWDGKINGGIEIAQQDVYIWKVELTDVFKKKHSFIGTVTIIK